MIGRVCVREGLFRVGFSWVGFVGRRGLFDVGWEFHRKGLSRVGLFLEWVCIGEGLSVCPKLRNPFLHTLSWPLLIRNVCCLVRAETRLTEGRK